MTRTRKQTEKLDTPATPGFRFTGNQFGVLTRPEVTIHSIEFIRPMLGTSGQPRIRAQASIGISRVSFEMTIEQALAADIIERV